ncbi:unnamed protein product [Sphagnum tenellum]
MDNKDTKSIVGGVESERAFSSDISSVKGHTSAVVHVSGQNEEFKADTHNLSSSSSEEGSPTNLGSNSEKFMSLMNWFEEEEGAFSSHICSVKGHTSAVVHAPGQNEELKADTHNVSSRSSQEGSTTNLCSSSSSSEEEVASSVVAPFYSASAPEYLWSEVRPRDPSGAETGNEEEGFRLVRRIHPSELEIVRKISEGGQAKIFFALLEHRPVVVKRYKDPNVSVADLQRQMEMVMKACERASKPGLGKVIGVSRDKKGKALLVMELMQCDLRKLIDSKKLFLHPSRKRDIVRGIARGLETLHACGRIHKDVEASNILVNLRLETPRLPDRRRRDSGSEDAMFGRRGGLRELDRTGVPVSIVDAYIGDHESVDNVWGTGFWRPPEVLQALKSGCPLEDLELAYLPAGDVYSFGMVLYKILTGRILFQGHSLSDYDLVISGERPDIPDDVMPEMRNLLLRCWHQDPHQRPSLTEIAKYFVPRERSLEDCRQM